MAKRIFIYSTLSNDNRYIQYAAGGADMPVAVDNGVLITGGANVPDRREDTPLGAVTEVTEDQLAYLRTVHLFNLHVENGFLTISGSKTDPEVAAANMTGRDASAPVVPEDLSEKEPQPLSDAAKTNARKA